MALTGLQSVMLSIRNQEVPFVAFHLHIMFLSNGGFVCQAQVHGGMYHLSISSSDMQMKCDTVRSLGSDSGCLYHGTAASPRPNSFSGNHLNSNCGLGIVLWTANWAAHFGLQ